MTIAAEVYAWASMGGYDLLGDSSHFNPHPEDFPSAIFEGWKEQPLWRSEILDHGHEDNGFYARSFQQEGSTDVIISFRGTDGFAEDAPNWAGFAYPALLTQLDNAIRYVAEVVAKGVPLESISFTGHSLGGGLAAAMGALFDRPATVFAPAPINVEAETAGLTASFLGAVLTVATLGIIQDTSVLEVLASLDLNAYPSLPPGVSLPQTDLPDYVPPPSQYLPENPTSEEYEAYFAQMEAHQQSIADRLAVLQNRALVVNVHRIDGEILSAFVGEDPANYGVNNVTEYDLGSSPEVSGIDLHSMSLHALAATRKDDGFRDSV